ncbi:HD domain-containing protein [Paenibacillus protaetiae]|nr:HD domain-containing protein [Paenibacillus protaetiae]
MKDYRLRLDGALDELWEPLWRRPIRLFPEEKALLRSKTIRRLQFVRHGGASFINTHHTYSRLQHTLGVFALAAHFDPDNRVLRAAALLHDTGHAPFSHTFESLEGVDHHLWTRDAVFAEEIAAILDGAKLDPELILDYIDGAQRSLLRNKDGVLHADHLDSYVRSAYNGGYLPVPAGELLRGMSYRDGHLDFELPAGRIVTGLIEEEARMHGSLANIGINAMMRKLARQLFAEGKIHAAELPQMLDAHIEQLLLSEDRTRENYEMLLLESWRIRVSREQPDVAAEQAVLHKLYLSMPLVDGISIAEISPQIRAMLQALEQMLGAYYVWLEKREGALMRSAEMLGV